MLSRAPSAFPFAFLSHPTSPSSTEGANASSAKVLLSSSCPCTGHLGRSVCTLKPIQVLRWTDQHNCPPPTLCLSSDEPLTKLLVFHTDTRGQIHGLCRHWLSHTKTYLQHFFSPQCPAVVTSCGSHHQERVIFLDC